VKAKALGRGDLAGKTGTSNEQRDAWFNGFNRRVVTVAWVGFDSFKPLGRGEVGGKAALPAWIDFMRVALDGMPEQTWERPDDIVTVRIDPVTGKRAAAGAEKAEFEVFHAGNEPALSEGGAVSGGGKADNYSGGSGESVTQDLF
jgi:penicillin-binding protein 1A